MPNEEESLPPPVQRRTVLQSIGLVAGGTAIGQTLDPALATDDVIDTETMPYELPDLPYEYDALEPHIDEQIMRLHHDGHHQAYVDGLNEAIDGVEGMRNAGDFEDVTAVKRDLAFNYSGHVNHSIFWENMAPDGGGEPQGDLANAIEESFDSFERFRAEFTETAATVQSVGWAMLFHDPLAEDLFIGQIESQHLLAHQDATPLLTLDVWEHAYYLQYENDRREYIEEWWDVVDWADVHERYEVAREADENINSESESH